MKPRHLLPFSAIITCVLTLSAQADDVIKANNTTNLNDAGSWLSGSPIPPDSTSVAVWNNTVVGANNSALGGNLSWQGIRIANPGGAVTISGSAGPATLTLGSAGIDMSAATQNLTFGSTIPVILSANQTWNIGSGRLLTYGAGALTSIDLNGNTLDTSGAGNIVIANRYNLTSATAATINVNNASFSFESGGSTTVSLASNITVNVAAGKVFQLRGNSGSGGIGINSNGLVNVDGGIFRIVTSNTVQINQTGKVTMTGNSSIDNQFGNNSANSRLQLSGGLEVTGTTTWTETNSSATATIFNSALTGGGTLNFQNTTTTRRADWSGDNSGFTGTVNINGGSGNRNLRLTSATAGSASATWAPASGNILEVDGVSVSLGTLNGAGTVTNSHATNVAAITVGAGSFSGAITNGTPANGMALTKAGSGTLTLSGANTYTGLTDIQGGTLTTTTAQTGGGVVTVADTATFGVTQLSSGSTFTTSSLILGSTTGSNLALTGSAAPSAAILTSPGFVVNGASKIILKGTPVNNMTLVDYTGTIGGVGFGGLTLVTPIRTSGTLFHDETNTLLQLTGFSSDTLKWQGNVSTVWDVDTTNTGAGSGATANWKTTAAPGGAYYVQAGEGLIDAPVFDDTATGDTAVTLNATVTPDAVTFANSTKSYSITGSGAIAGLTGVAKSGSGSLSLGTANTFSGGVQLNDGTLNVNHANALGSGALTVTGGTLDNTSGSAKVAANAQNWNGDFTFTGSNDLTLGSAAMDASRQVTVNGGTLTVGGVGGSYSLTKAGAGNLTISGGAAYSGGTTVSAGGLKLVNTKTGSSNFVTDGNLEFNLTSGNQQLNGGTISGTGSLIKSGGSLLMFGANGSPQTVALTGENSVIDVQGGVLRNEYYNSTWGSNKAGLNVASGAVFDVWDGTTTVDELNGSGTINKGWSANVTLTIGVNDGSGNFSGVILNNATNLGYGGSTGGQLSLVKQGTGTQTLSGVNTYAGATTINGGTLALGAAGSIDNSSGVSLGTAGTFDVSAKSGGYTVTKLTGSGDVIGSLSVSTQLAIGNSPGIIDVTGSLTLGNGSTFAYDMVGGTSNADLGNIGGTLTIGSNVILDLVELGTYTVGNKFTLFGYTSLVGTFDGLADGSEFTDDLSNKWQIDYDDASGGLNGGTGVSFVTITAVPEPAAALLGAFGLLALLRRRRVG